MPKSRRAHAKVKVRFLRFIDSPPKNWTRPGPGRPIQSTSSCELFMRCPRSGPLLLHGQLDVCCAARHGHRLCGDLPSSLQVFKV